MYVDSDFFLAVIRREDRLKPLAEKIFSGKESKCTSAVTIMELEFVLERKVDKQASINVLEIFYKTFPKVNLISLDEKVLAKGLELRKSHGLGMFDSIHAATALLNDKRIVSTDYAFDKVPSLTRITG